MKSEKNQNDHNTDHTNIIVLKSTRPNECGGTDATLDTSAPKVIKSREINLFCIKAKIYLPMGSDIDPEDAVYYLSAFAVPCVNGTFLYIETKGRYEDSPQNKTSAAITQSPIFSQLIELADEFKLSENNGYHSFTHGLPENFGGEINIEYTGGEKISISDNQSPVISYDCGMKILGIFNSALKNAKRNSPDLSTLKEIRFYKKKGNDNCGFTEARLILNGNEGLNIKKEQFSDSPEIYESEKPVDNKTVALIKKIIEDSYLYLWPYLPEKNDTSATAEITLVFEDKTIIVQNNRLIPSEIRGGFFNIELELTVKN